MTDAPPRVAAPAPRRISQSHGLGEPYASTARRLRRDGSLPPAECGTDRLVWASLVKDGWAEVDAAGGIVLTEKGRAEL